MTGYGLQLVTPPAEEPVSLAALKVHLRLDDSDDAVEESDLDEKLQAARAEFEEATRRQLVTATWKLILDRFPLGSDAICLPKPPLQSVSLIRYRDGDGNWATLDADDYAVSAHREPGIVRMAYGLSWPTPRCEPDAVEVTFVCGYGAAAAVPGLAKSAIKLRAGELYRFREAVEQGQVVEVPLGWQRIVNQFDTCAEFTPWG